MAVLYHGLRDRRTWTLWTSSIGDTCKKLCTGIHWLTWKTWQQSFMLLWRPLMQTCYDVCKLVFHDVRLHVGECMVDTLNTYCNYRPLSYVSAVCCVLCRQALHASQVLFILTCVNYAFFLCTLFFCINSLVQECHLQFLFSWSTLRVSASVSQRHH
jgi:hypothetical protein